MNLKKLREVNGLTQEEVAKIMNVKRELISYYENGKREISVTNLKKLLDFLGIDMEDFKNERYGRKIQVAYRKDYILEEDFKEVVWLNRFVMNISELKKINSEEMK